MTNHWVDIKNANLILIMGGNAAEAHPCGFKWVTDAKAHNKARLIVVDPRFTRSVASPICMFRSAPAAISPGSAPDQLSAHQRQDPLRISQGLHQCFVHSQSRLWFFGWPVHQ